MPILTRQANIVTSPFGGGNPVVNPTLTGHDSSNVSVGGGGQTDTKSIRWHNFLGVPGKINSIRVKFDWSRSASQSGGGVETWIITVDDGTNSDVLINETNILLTGSGSVDALLVNCAGSPITSLSITETILASDPILAGSASLTVTISNVRMEIDHTPFQLPVIILM